jgi:hypothetical protein
MRIRFRPFVLGALLAGGAIVAPLSFGAASTSLPSCATAQLVPNISELAVDQGLPQGTSYTRLARGKDALVRAYLTTPSSCALTRSESITPQSASLTVNNGVATTTIANAEALSGNVASAQQISATSDPYFFVPGSVLEPANGGAAFNSAFTVTVTYKATNGTTVVNGTTSTTASNASKTVPVDQKANALRVLVVPMGDPSSTATQFSANANSSVQQLLTAADRVFPVPTGTGSLGSNSGGLRYSFNGGLLDVKSLGLFTGGKFCSNATNYASSLVTSGAFAGLTLKGQLQQALSDYNGVTTNPPADIVVGVIDENIAWASASGTSCPAAAGFTAGPPDDGRASTPTAGALGKPAWVRVTYPAPAGSGGPSPMVMEIAHNLGISRCCPSFHSSNIAADGTAANHAMNVLARKVLYTGGALGSSHSAMNYNTTTGVPYTPDNVTFEPGDWSDMLCDLGGVDSTNLATPCALSTSVGTANGVAANAFDINGTTDGSSARVTNSYATSVDLGLQTQGDPNSTTRLILSDGTSCSSPGNTLLNFGLPVERDEGHTAGDQQGGTDTQTNPTSFHGLVPLPSGTTTVRLLVNGTTQYCRSPQTTPDVTSTTTQPADLGVLLRSFSMPGGGSNGRGIAFDSKTNTLYGTFADPNTNLYEFSTSGSLIRTVGIDKTAGSLAYDPNADVLYGGNLTSAQPTAPDNGKVYTISTGTAPTITGTLFQADLSGDTTCRGGNPGAIDGLAYYPSSNMFALSGDAALFAHIVSPPSGEIGWTVGAGFSVAAAGSDCNSGIASDGDAGAWYALLGSSGTTTTFVHRPSINGTADMSFQVPNYEAEDIEYDPVTFAPRCALWTNQATGGTPQIRAYSVPCAGAQPSDAKTVTFTATGSNLVGTAYVTCGGSSPKYPVADSLSPAATEDAVSTFTFAFSPTLSCANGTPTIITTVSDGIHQSSLSGSNASTTITSPPKDPIPSIDSPSSNELYAGGSKIALNGSAFDYSDGVLSGDRLAWTIDGNPAGTGTAVDVAAPGAGEHTVTLTATNSAGRSSSASVTIHVDGTPPVLMLTPAGDGATANVSASDNAAGDSGLANVFCSNNNVPAALTPAFTPGPTYSGTLSYSTIQQLSCTAYDRAGNEATANIMSEFGSASQNCGGVPGRTVLQPINPDNSSVFKKGSIVPVKFTVCLGGTPVGPTPVVTSAREFPPDIPQALLGGTCSALAVTPPPGSPVLCKIGASSGSIDEAVYSNTPDTAFRWSPPQWVFNLGTSNLAAGTYIYYIPLIDGTNIFFKFGLK